MSTAQIEVLTELLVESDELATSLTSEFCPGSTPLVAPLVDAIDIVVFVTGPSGSLRYVNAAWTRLTGFSGGVVAESIDVDALGNPTTTTRSVDRAHALVLESTVYPDAGAGHPEQRAMRGGRLERSMRRRLERMREPSHFHPIGPLPRTEYPSREAEEQLAQPDVATRKERRGSLEKDLRKRLAKRLPTDRLDAFAPRAKGPEPLRTSRSLPPIAFAGRPEVQSEQASADSDAMPPPRQEPIKQGDSLAARARRLQKQRKQDT